LTDQLHTKKYRVSNKAQIAAARNGDQLMPLQRGGYQRKGLAMSNASQIKEHMEVKAADGAISALWIASKSKNASDVRA
jgi:hypothetical protein